MADRRFTYRVEIDASSAAAQARQVRSIFQRELGRIQASPTASMTGMAGRAMTPAATGSTPSLGGGGSRELLPGLGGLSSLGGFTLAGAAIGGLVTQSAMLAVELDKDATAFRRSSRAAAELAGSQEKLTALMGAYQQASGGAVDKATALEQVTRLQAVGFADTAQELERFVRASRGASIATGGSIEYIQSQMQLAIANKSTLRLDQLGIGVSEFKTRMDELKASMAGASEEMLYQEALLSLMEDKFGGIVDSAEGAATGIERLRVAWEDLRLELALHVSPVVDYVAGLAATQLQGGPSTTGAAGRAVVGAHGSAYRNAGFNAHFLYGDNGRRMAELDRLNDQVYGAIENGAEFPQSYLDSLDQLTEKAATSGKVTADMVPTLERLKATVGGVVQPTYDMSGAMEAGSVAADRLARAQRGLNEAFIAAQGLLQATYGGQTFINLPQVGMRPVQGPGLPSDEYLRQQSIMQGGGFLTPGGNSMGDIRAGWQEQWRRQNEQATKDAIREREQAERAAITSAQRSWDDAAEATKRAFRDAASELENSIRQIPGLFGTSSVSGDQMRMADLGVPQNFADNYLRRLTDEVLNGVDWEGVDIGDAARRAGLDEALSPEAILEIFRQKWSDQSLFANAANLDLFDQDAIRAEMERQRQSKLGSENIMSMFGLGKDGEGTVFTGLGSTIAGGMMSGAQEGLAEFGQTAIQDVMAQLGNDNALREYATLGAQTFGAMEAGWLDAAQNSSFVSGLVGIVMAQISEMYEGEN